MSDYFPAPSTVIESLQLREFVFGEFEAIPRDVLITRHPANRSLASGRAISRPFNDPFEYPHILAEPRPQEIPAFIFAEPVHVKDTRRHSERTLHGEPMAKVVAHVISAEGQHRHGIAAHLANCACRCRCRFRSHRCAYVDAGAPVEGLVHQRHRSGATTPKDKCTDWYAFRIFPGRVDGRALRSGRGESGVRVSGLATGLSSDLRSPPVSLPIRTLCWRFVR